MKDNLITVERSRRTKYTQTTGNMSIGDIAILAEQYEDGFIMKTYGDGLVLLNNPEHTWNTSPNLEIKEILPIGSKLTITLGKAVKDV